MEGWEEAAEISKMWVVKECLYIAYKNNDWDHILKFIETYIGRPIEFGRDILLDSLINKKNKSLLDNFISYLINLAFVERCYFKYPKVMKDFRADEIDRIKFKVVDIKNSI